MTEDDFLDRITNYSEELHQKLCRFAHTPGVLNHQVQPRRLGISIRYNYPIMKVESLCEHHAALLLSSVATLTLLNPRQRLLLLHTVHNLAHFRMVSSQYCLL